MPNVHKNVVVPLFRPIDTPTEFGAMELPEAVNLIKFLWSQKDPCAVDAIRMIGMTIDLTMSKKFGEDWRNFW